MILFDVDVIFLKKNMLILTLFVSLVSGTTTSPSPCRVTWDTTYQGRSADCMQQHISSLPLNKNWLPSGITTLLLNFNSINHLDKHSFSFLETPSTLRYLNLAHNKIMSIDAGVFSRLTALEKLDLRFNYLNLDRESHSLRGDVFRGLGSLLELDLSDNNNTRISGNYLESLFIDLHNLEALSLETFRGKLQFGSLFKTTNKLSSLTLSGNMSKITNQTFKSFESIRLRKLVITNAPYLESAEVGAMNYFKYLDCYTNSGSSQTINNILETLAPFVNRNMSQLNIEYVGNRYKISKKNTQDSAITLHMARYLIQICLERFSLVGSMVAFIDSGVFKNKLFAKCLKSIDISGNPITGGFIEFLSIVLLRKLEYVKVTDNKYACVSGAGNYEWHPPVCASNVKGQSRHLKRIPVLEGSFSRGIRYPETKITHANINNSIDGPSILFTRGDATRKASKKLQTPVDNQVSHVSEQGYIHFHVPPKLRIIKLNSLTYFLFAIDLNTFIEGGENIEEIHLADNGLDKFTASVRGLSNLKLLDISRNNGSIISSTFFDHMPSITNLNMADMKLQPSFISDFSDRLFKNLTELRCLDLSNNDIEYLATGTFEANPKISLLMLADNRFHSIPFNLLHSPNLCWLDLRRNSFRLVSNSDIDILENYTHVANSFSLSLAGNEFFCGCNSIRFLAWLKRTRINLDNGGNYSCLSDSGIRTSTGQIEDLEAMSRLCHGQTALWLSLVLMCMMVLCFICCGVISRFKTQLRAFFLTMLWTPHLMKTPDDYPIGVYIGYADDDTNLACQRLRQYVELELRLSTYVRHRDLLPASDMAEAIVESVYSSWRVLLLVSHHFLDDPWTYFLLKVSTCSVQAENPGRIVLVLVDGKEHDSLLSKVPQGLIKAVQEESIITMTPQGNISYEDKQALKTALLYRL